MVVLQYL